MAKNSVTDWSETAGDNTDVGGVNIAEGCAPSGINNAIRTVMSQIKAFFKANVFRLRDNTDETKLLAFDLSGITTATTRTITVPDASGTMALVGDAKLVQYVSTKTGASATGTTLIPADDTEPQITEGTQFMTLAVTPTSATNTLEISVVVNIAFSTGGYVAVALFQDSTANALATVATFIEGSNRIVTMAFTHIMTAGTTSETTFRVRAGADVAGTVTFNGYGGSRRYGGTMASSIAVSEILV